MDFVLYPLDVQNCAIDFSSCKYLIALTSILINTHPAQKLHWRVNIMQF